MILSFWIISIYFSFLKLFIIVDLKLIMLHINSYYLDNFKLVGALEC